jgi:uncharacterized cupin superfamily protein
MSQHPYRCVNLGEAELQAQSHGRTFAFARARLGKTLGLTRIGCSYLVLPPGKAAFPFHKHHVTDELFVILEGEGEQRWGDERHPVRAGDVISAPRATEAHQIVNTGDRDLCYLALSDIGSEDVVEYPDSGKVAFAAGVEDADFKTASITFLGKLSPPMNYYDGEPE